MYFFLTLYTIKCLQFKCTDWWVLTLDTQQSRYRTCSLYPLAINLHTLQPWLQVSMVFCHYRLILHVTEFHINEIIYHVLFCVSLLSLSITFLRFMHVVLCIFISMDSIQLHIPQFVYPFTYWWLFGLFPFWG